VHNPVILTKPKSSTWTKLVGVQRLEIEDPEATQNTIPKQIVTDLPNLESLSVTWTKIKTLPPTLFQLPLKSLYLQRNHIKSISGIEKASELAILDISNNRVDCLPKSFGQLQSLVTLNVSGNGLHELPESVGSLSQLKTLDCSCNKLKSLPNSLSFLIELTSLDVSNNHLSALPESVGYLPKLEDLRLTSNQLTCLPESFGQLIRLNSLLLRNNKFEEVPAQLSSLSNLQSLNMRENLIRHVDRPISSLKYLILDQNQLTQIDVGILQCANLQHLSVKSNSIVEINGSVSKLTNIRSLNLSNNGITDIPAELSTLAHLRHLSLCATKIQTVPIGLACMQSLKTLELDDCAQLEGYLNIAYKTGGLAGVIDHLKKKSQEANEKRVRPESLYPDDGHVVKREASGKSQTIRNKAGFSIVIGTSVTPPASEAMLQVDSGGQKPTQLVHVARQSICPTEMERPSKPFKPPNLAARNQNKHEPTGSNTPQQSMLLKPNVGRSIAEDDATGVIATMPEFGDLVSSSSTEEQKRHSGTRGRTAADKGDEPNPLPAGITSRAGGAERPRPPTKKPSKLVAT